MDWARMLAYVTGTLVDATSRLSNEFRCVGRAAHLRSSPQDPAPSCFHVASTGGIGDWAH